MHDIQAVAQLLRETRIRSGLTQEDVATRVGTSQSAIASLESGDTNPTVDTLVRCAAAVGIALQVLAKPLPVQDQVVERFKQDVDRTLLRENLRKSVDERLSSLGGWQEDARKLQRATAEAKRARARASGRST